MNKINSWTNIEVAYIKPKPKREEGIDWLDIVEKTKKECKIKTTALPQYLLQTVRKCHISNKTEINKVI